MDPISDQRRRVLVDRKFQLQYLWIWLLTGLGLTVIAIAMWLGWRRWAGGGNEPLVLRVVGGMTVFIVLFCLLMGVLSVAMTHRVAGAAYRLERCVDRMLEGEYSQNLTLRRNDYLQTLAERLSRLQQRLLRQRTETDEAARLVEEATGRLESQGKLSAEAREALACFRKKLDEIRGLPSGPATETAPRSGRSAV